MKIKNEKKALQMFCSDDEYYRKKLTRPFIIESCDDKVVATDGYIMLIANRKLLRCKYETDKLNIPQQSCKSISIPISFAAIDEAHHLLQLEEEEVSEDGKDKDCPECCGSGKVDFEYTAENGEIYYHECDCPICEGTGIRADYVPVKTGRMLIPAGSVFVMRHTIFDARRVWKVVEALRLMGFEQITWVCEDEKGANFFDVCDGMQLVMMPMANTGSFKQEIRVKLKE